ncbi:hypothetical protein BKA80DRAFT_123512 [Phyllosticta citrichinensis]
MQIADRRSCLLACLAPLRQRALARPRYSSALPLSSRSSASPHHLFSAARDGRTTTAPLSPPPLSATIPLPPLPRSVSAVPARRETRILLLTGALSLGMHGDRSAENAARMIVCSSAASHNLADGFESRLLRPCAVSALLSIPSTSKSEPAMENAANTLAGRAWGVDDGVGRGSVDQSIGVPPRVHDESDCWMESPRLLCTDMVDFLLLQVCIVAALGVGHRRRSLRWKKSTRPCAWPHIHRGSSGVDELVSWAATTSLWSSSSTSTRRKSRRLLERSVYPATPGRPIYQRKDFSHDDAVLEAQRRLS